MKGPVKRNARLTIRLPDGVLARVKKLAEDEGRSAADWSFRVLEAAVIRTEKRLARKKKKSASSGEEGG